MKLRLLFTACCSALLLQPAASTLLLKKKLAAAGLIAAGVNKLGLWGGTAAPAERDEEKPVSTTVEMNEKPAIALVAEPKPIPALPYAILLHLPQPQVLRVQQPVAPYSEGSYYSSNQYARLPVGAPKPGIVGILGKKISPIRGNLASLWDKSNQAVLVQTNRVRDRFHPLKPLSYLINKVALKPTLVPAPVQYKFVPNLGFTHYNEIRYFPVKAEQTHTDAAIQEFPKISEPIVETRFEQSVPKAEYGPPPKVYSVGDANTAQAEYGVPVEHYAGAVSFQSPTPKLEYTSPKTGYPAPEAEYSVPKSEYSAPKAEYSAPEMEYTTPAAGYSGAKAEYSAPNADYSASKVEYSTPAAGYSVPKEAVTSAAVEYGPPAAPEEEAMNAGAAPVGQYPPSEEYRPANVFRSERGDTEFTAQSDGSSYHYTLLKA